MPIQKRRKADDIDALYDSFEKKDMSRLAFRQAMKRVTDQRLMERDLGRIMTQKEVQKSALGIHRN
jgi:hypothetical protein